MFTAINRTTLYHNEEDLGSECAEECPGITKKRRSPHISRESPLLEHVTSAIPLLQVPVYMTVAATPWLCPKATSGYPDRRVLVSFRSLHAHVATVQQDRVGPRSTNPVSVHSLQIIVPPDEMQFQHLRVSQNTPRGLAFEPLKGVLLRGSA
jgi:hypothetical protein